MTIAIAFLVYAQMFIPGYLSDTSEHLQYILPYIDDSRQHFIPHPLWHLSVYYIAYFFGIHLEYAAITFSTFSVGLWIYLVYYLVSTSNPHFCDLKKTLITFSVIIIVPLTIPIYNPNIFLGQSSPNIWHNVTLWTLKPLALLSVYLTFKAINTNNTKIYFLALAITLASIFAKPSFIIIFLPALFLVILLKQFYTKKNVLYFFIVSLFSLIILVYQYTYTFGNEETKLIIDFLGVWSAGSKNIPISIFLALAFPLTLLVLYPHILRHDYILLSWLQTLLAMLLFATFAQTGELYLHGNFGWSYAIALSLLYLFSIIYFFKELHNLTTLKKSILFTLLFIQTFTGFYYFLSILNGTVPLYVNLTLKDILALF